MNPNQKYRHIYPVVRLDMFQLDMKRSVATKEELETYIAVTKVFFNKETAEEEAIRLNELNGDKNVHYWVAVSRLSDEAALV